MGIVILANIIIVNNVNVVSKLRDNTIRLAVRQLFYSKYVMFVAEITRKIEKLLTIVKSDFVSLKK